MGNLPTLGIPHAEDLHVLVPDRHVAIHRLNRDAEEALRKLEEAVLDNWQIEVLRELLLGIGVHLLALALAPVRLVPGLQPADEAIRGGERRQRGVLLRGDWTRGRGQFVDHRVDRGHGRRALRRERKVRIVFEPKQRGELLAQREDAVDERRVVEVPRGGARRARPEKRLAHGTIPRMLHERRIDGVLDRRLPGTLLRIVLARHHRLQLRGQPLNLDWRREHEREALRRVEHVVVEIIGELGEFGLNLVETPLLHPFQRHARELGALNHLVENAEAGGGLGGREGCAQGLRELVEAAGLPDAQRERDDVALELLLDLAPGLGVADALHVGDDAPGGVERMLRVVERAHETLPVGRRGGLERVDARPGLL